jgi:DNA polymerase-1
VTTLPFYHAHYRDLFGPLLDMMTGGICVDRARRAHRYAARRADCDTLRAMANALAGVDVFGPKALSRTKLAAYLYGTLNLPKRYTGRGTDRRVTTDEVAIRRLALRHPEQVGDFATLINRFVRADKLSQFLTDTVVDPDGRMRCTYKVTTETGRLASAKNPKRTGLNLQNQDREVRDCFLPDPGHIWLSADYSQIEARLCYVLTGDDELIALARSLPWEFDIHIDNAQRIFGRPVTRADKERELGKKTEHAFQRGMGCVTMSDNLLKEGFLHPPAECQRFLDAYDRARPAVRRDYFIRIRQQLMRTKRLTNSWGRVWDVRHERFDDELYRRGYSWPPQSEAAGLINQCVLIPSWRYAKQHRLRSRLLAQVHDEVAWSAHPDEAWDLWQRMRAQGEVERSYGGVALRVPLEVKLGTSWACEVKFATPPTRDEFVSAVRELRGRQAGGGTDEALRATGASPL